MGQYLEKKEVKEALKKAKDVEKEHIPTPAEEAGIQKEAVSLSERLKRLLAPAWFIKDVDRKEKVRALEKKSEKKTKKKKK